MFGEKPLIDLVHLWQRAVSMFPPTARSGFKSTKSYRIINSDIIDSISASASMLNVDLMQNLLPVFIVLALK